MSKTVHQKAKTGYSYEKRDGDVYIRFVKPIRFVKKMIYEKRSIMFQIPL